MNPEEAIAREASARREARHELVAIDAETAECSCGEWSGQGSFLLHLREVAP